MMIPTIVRCDLGNVALSLQECPYIHLKHFDKKILCDIIILLIHLFLFFFATVSEVAFVAVEILVSFVIVS